MLKMNAEYVKKVIKKGTSLVVEDTEQCLTCGGKKRLVTIETKEDKPVIVEYCLLCLVKKNGKNDASTAANRGETCSFKHYNY